MNTEDSCVVDKKLVNVVVESVKQNNENNSLNFPIA